MLTNAFRNMHIDMDSAKSPLSLKDLEQESIKSKIKGKLSSNNMKEQKI